MAAADTNDISDRDYVNSLARGLEVICAFTRTRPRMTLSEIARATGMTRATVRRFLLTLVREGYAEKDDKVFSLKPKVLELGYSALSSMGILEVAQPIMNDLSKALQGSVFCAVLTSDDVTYIARITSEAGQCQHFRGRQSPGACGFNRPGAAGRRASGLDAPLS